MEKNVFESFNFKNWFSFLAVSIMSGCKLGKAATIEVQFKRESVISLCNIHLSRWGL